VNGREGLLRTTVVGSYPQPGWLIDREQLQRRAPPRTRARELWRAPEDVLDEAMDDAAILAIRDMERAGIDIVTDGETRRESYSNRFANALGGVDLEHPGVFVGRNGGIGPAPRIVGPIRWQGPVEVAEVEFLKRSTERPIKITTPGPFTLAQQTQDEHYRDERALALDYAEAVRHEVKALFAAGVDVVQLDEPYLEARPEQAREYGIEAINRALEGIEGTSALHLCFGYGYIVKDKPSTYSFLEELNDTAVDQISIEAAEPGLDPATLSLIPQKAVIYGVVSCGEAGVESAETVADRIRSALRYITPERLLPAPDCGMKYLPRDVAFAKLRALVEGTRIVRAELS
jgi:5-methyltetrahydropteroyltriglutamate--homocysteine methyltransferase